MRTVALLAPRRQAFPVNKTARGRRRHRGDDRARRWRLELVAGERADAVSRQDLLADAAADASRCRSPASRAGRRRRRGPACGSPTSPAPPGVPDARACFVESLQPGGVLREATLSADQVADERSLLALQVDGEDLSLDHGYPARIIVPALPGVHNTKWVARMTFR